MSQALNPRPAFDPELQSMLDALGPQPSLTLDLLPAARAGRVANDPAALIAGRRVGHHDVEIPGHDGDPISIAVFARDDHTASGPGIVFIHGGGMVLGDRFDHVHIALDWVERHDAVVVSVDYRLAPEFPDPYPVEDCYASLRWTVEHAGELGIDPTRILIAGGSAGGGLAAGTALLARDRGGPALIGQLLLCPMLDDRDRSVSAEQIDGVGVWDRGSNRTGWGALLGTRSGTGDVSIYAAPARATDLSGLPPAFIDCGSAEVFRDEDVAYASALWAAGVQAELHVWPGGFHGFFEFAPDTVIARRAIAAREAWIDTMLA